MQKAVRNTPSLNKTEITSIWQSKCKIIKTGLCHSGQQHFFFSVEIFYTMDHKISIDQWLRSKQQYLHWSQEILQFCMKPSRCHAEKYWWLSALSPLLTHQRYCSHSLSHWHEMMSPVPKGTNPVTPVTSYLNLTLSMLNSFEEIWITTGALHAKG